MNATARFLIGTFIIVSILYPTLTALYAWFLPPAALSGLPFGIGISVINVTGSYFLNAWGSRRGNRVFLRSFVSGLLGRFAMIGLAAVVAYRIPAIDFRGTLFAVIAAFFPLVGFEVYCLVRDLDAVSSSPPPAVAR